jgi:hypothetical protein
MGSARKRRKKRRRALPGAAALDAHGLALCAAAGYDRCVAPQQGSPP